MGWVNGRVIYGSQGNSLNHINIFLIFKLQTIRSKKNVYGEVKGARSLHI